MAKLFVNTELDDLQYPIPIKITDITCNSMHRGQMDSPPDKANINLEFDTRSTAPRNNNMDDNATNIPQDNYIFADSNETIIFDEDYFL